MRLAPDLVYAGRRFQPGLGVDFAGGRIVAVGPDSGESGALELAGKALLPGTVNAHCHSFQSLLRGLGDDLDFMAWRDRVLYPYSARLDRGGIYLGAAFAFAEMLLHGVTTCVDFFYLQDEGNDNAEAVIQAARDVGIRLVLARTMYDWDGAPARYRERPAAAARRTADLIAKYRRDPLIRVQPAPHSPHGASAGMIRAGFEVAQSADTRLSVFEEMRMAALLQKVRHLDGTRLPAEHAFRMGTLDGGRLLDLEVGDIRPGMLADLVAVDLTHPSLHPPGNLLKSVVYAMSPQAVTDVWVHGRPIVQDGRLTTLDQDDLMVRVAALTRGWTSAGASGSRPSRSGPSPLRVHPSSGCMAWGPMDTTSVPPRRRSAVRPAWPVRAAFLA